MDWLTFLTSLIESLAWPVAIVIVILTMRGPIARLLPELRELQYKDLRVEFGKKLEEIEAHAERAQLPERSEEPVLLSGEDYPKTFPEYVARIAEISPRAAIAEAWRFVEVVLNEIAEQHNLPPPNSLPAIEHFLRRHGHVPEATTQLLRELRQLRNRAVHAGDFELTSEQAREYGELAVRLTSALQSAIPRNPSAAPSPPLNRGASRS